MSNLPICLNKIAESETAISLALDFADAVRHRDVVSIGVLKRAQDAACQGRFAEVKRLLSEFDATPRICRHLPTGCC